MNPHGEGGQDPTVSDEEAAISAQNAPSGQNSESGERQDQDTFRHGIDTSGHKKCALCVPESGVPKDLIEVIKAWPRLSDDQKRNILGLIGSQGEGELPS